MKASPGGKKATRGVKPRSAVCGAPFFRSFETGMDKVDQPVEIRFVEGKREDFGIWVGPRRIRLPADDVHDGRRRDERGAQGHANGGFLRREIVSISPPEFEKQCVWKIFRLGNPVGGKVGFRDDDAAVPSVAGDEKDLIGVRMCLDQEGRPWRSADRQQQREK